MGAMNRGMNLPQIQRIMHEFEKESATMDMKEEMMSDAVDDVMGDELEDEEEEGDKILRQVLDEIGVDLSQQVSRQLDFELLSQNTWMLIRLAQLTDAPTGLAISSSLTEPKQAVALGDGGPAHPSGGASGGGAYQTRTNSKRGSMHYGEDSGSHPEASGRIPQTHTLGYKVNTPAY